MATENNITIEQGTNLEIDFVVKFNSVILDITGYTARLMVKPKYTGTAIISATTENGKLTVTNGAGGVVTWIITPTETDSITFPGNEDTKEFVYDLEIINTQAKVYRASQGTITLTRNVTR